VNSSVQIRLQWHAVTVSERKRETNRAITLILTPSDPAVTFDYLPGQYVNVMLDVEGESCCRSYSISGDTGEGGIMITVQAVAGGKVSRYLNEHMAVGNTLHCSLPVGSFRIMDPDRETVFMAAGSGITPIVSMLRTQLTQSRQPCVLYYFTRSAEDTIFMDEVADLAAQFRKQLTVVHWFSAERGRFCDLARLKGSREAFQDTADVYLCGPTDWMHCLKDALMSGRIGYHKLYQEAFSNTVSNQDEPVDVQPDADRDLSCTIRVRVDDKDFVSQASVGERVLSVLRRHDVPITSGCEMGKCGSCLARITSGKVDLRDTGFLLEEEIEDGLALCCQAYVVGDCGIEVE